MLAKRSGGKSMANQEHLDILKQRFDFEDGGERWDKWRKHHPDIRPDLSNAQLMDVNLSFTNLEETNLEGANLRGATLVYSDFSGANLVHTNLSRADLTNANLSRVILGDTNFSEADLRMADLR